MSTKKIVIKLKQSTNQSTNQSIDKVLLTYVDTYLPITFTHFKSELFDEIANIFLNQTLINAGQRTYRICEIEFYYCGNGHNDTYVHCSEEQRMKCKFYFHKYHTGTYKSGTYKGLDVTISPNDNIYFGVLIRSIQDCATGEFIEGPCRSVNVLLSQFNCDNVQDFMKNKVAPLDIYNTSSGLYLTHPSSLDICSIYKGPRIGLSDKDLIFRDKLYRYAIMINNIKKKRNTFVLVE